MKVVLFSLFTLLFISDAEKHLNGVYLLKSFKYGDATEWSSDNRRKVVKVFKDGYWMCVYFDDHRPNHKLFGGACGGTFELTDGKYVEGHDFYSWDSTHVGQFTKMDYKVDEKGFEQYGKINSNKYKDYQVVEKFERIESSVILKSPALEGVWVLKERYVKGEKEKIKGQYLRIIQYPVITMAQGQPVVGLEVEYSGSGGGGNPSQVGGFGSSSPHVSFSEKTFTNEKGFFRIIKVVPDGIDLDGTQLILPYNSNNYVETKKMECL